MTPAWVARLVAPDTPLDSAPRLRGEVPLRAGHGPVVRAVLHYTAHGVVEAWLGGERADDAVLTPGWTSYEWRLRYRTVDVTGLVSARHALDPGRPLVLGLLLGNGWYRGRLGFHGGRALYGSERAGLAQLDLTYDDGCEQVVGTDDSWRAGPSEVLTDDLYDGQTVDARRRDDSWLEPGADVSANAGWCGVHVVDRDLDTLVPYLAPPVRRHDTLRPERVWTDDAGRTLVDFGQNVAGWVRLRIGGESGTEVTVRHAEVLDRDDALATRPLRSAAATDRYVLSGRVDDLEPTFTVHGFRYCEISGLPAEVRPQVEAVVVHTDLERIGTFECSDPMLNRLHENVVWSFRSNVVDLPTDCPQRDERLGWTGDIAVFAPTAAYLFDVTGFLGDWLADLAVEQAAAGGRVPYVVPDALKLAPAPEGFLPVATTALWSDAAVWVPWALWWASGDVDALARQFGAALEHARHVVSLLSPTHLWDNGFQLGDWLDPTAPPDDPLRAAADPAVVATACAARTFALTAELAAALGRTSVAREMGAAHRRTRQAFRDHYVADGRIRSDCQTVYALAIAFGLLDIPSEAAAGRRLADLVRQAGYTVSTGFAGTPFVLDALTRTGHAAEAHRMLAEQRCPSWLYPVSMGATTVWERWDSMLPDGTVNPGEMTSFNHYALGAVADWMHRTLGGIRPLEPGYRRVRVEPSPGGGVTWARSSLRTPHGMLRVSWELDDHGETVVEVDAPPGVEVVIAEPSTRGRRAAG
ncbi:MAG: family 78 glycoside hydrolase catalytic domain [Dermatophilaceae bacterium]